MSDSLMTSRRFAPLFWCQFFSAFNDNFLKNATLFGPVKYGILPDHLKKEELPAGNALVEGATFMAILLGTIVGGLAAKEGGHVLGFGAMIMAFAALCW